MRIGIDAKWFFTGNPSGKVVIRNVVKHMIDLNTDHELFLFLRMEDRDKAFPYLRENVHLVYIWAGNNMLSNLFVFPFKARSLRLDVVLFQTFVPFFAFRKSIAFIYDCIYLTNPEYFPLTERLYYFPIKHLVRFARQIITISESEKRRIIGNMQVDESFVTVAHCGVNEDYVPATTYDRERIRAVTEKYSLPEEYLLYVGRLNIRKNILNLLTAVSLMKNRNIPLLLAGGRDFGTQEIEDAIVRLNLGHRVRLLGYVDGDDLPLVYALAKIFCYVSFDEGFGMPPLEAMACSVPVVVANSSSLPEICKDAGTYVDPFSPADIAEKLDLLLIDGRDYDEKRRKALANSKQFTWRASAKVIYDLLQSKNIDNS